MFGGKREETKRGLPLLPLSKAALANPPHLQTFNSPSIPLERGLIFFTVAKMSDDQPGEVRYPHFVSNSFLIPFLTIRESPLLRNQLGHSSSNRVPRIFLPLLNLIIHSTASQTSLAISPRLPPRLSFSPPFPSPNFPVRHNPSQTSRSLYPHWLAYSILVRASRALRRNIARQNARGSRPPCSQMVHQYTQGPIYLT